jgi:hypothetical protein
MLIKLFDIPGIENYQVTEDGRVWSKGRYVRDNRGIRLVKGRWLSQREGKDGYLLVWITDINHKQLGYKVGVHVLVCLAFHGPKPFPKAQVRHFPDRNVQNNNHVNLSWCTSEENHEDMRKHGTVLFGSKNPAAKLRDDDIPIIKWLLELGYSSRSIGDIFGVSKRIVGLIDYDILWSYIK